MHSGSCFPSASQRSFMWTCIAVKLCVVVALCSFGPQRKDSSKGHSQHSVSLDFRKHFGKAACGNFSFRLAESRPRTAWDKPPHHYIQYTSFPLIQSVLLVLRSSRLPRIIFMVCMVLYSLYWCPSPPLHRCRNLKELAKVNWGGGVYHPPIPSQCGHRGSEGCQSFLFSPLLQTLLIVGDTKT